MQLALPRLGVVGKYENTESDIELKAQAAGHLLGTGLFLLEEGVDAQSPSYFSKRNTEHLHISQNFRNSSRV